MNIDTTKTTKNIRTKSPKSNNNKEKLGKATTTVVQGGIKKRKTPKHRLYSSFQHEKMTKKEARGEDLSDVHHSSTVMRRNKINWYQKSSELPTSVNTLKKELCQLFDILKAQGLLRLDEEVVNPLKKVRPIVASTINDTTRDTNNDDGVKKRKKSQRRKGGSPIIDKFSISKEALQNIHQTHAFYVGEVLKTAQEIVDNGKKKITATPDILDLALVFTHKSIGPKWNMMLEPQPSSLSSSSIN